MNPKPEIKIGDVVNFVAPWSLGPARAGKTEPARVTNVHGDGRIDLITNDGHRFGPVEFDGNGEAGNTFNFAELPAGDAPVRDDHLSTDNLDPSKT